MHTTITTESENMNAQTTPENGHCFWIDSKEIVDIDDLAILKDGMKANMGATVNPFSNNEIHLVYVGY